MTLVFRWTALSRAGLVRRGSLSAPSQSACAQELEAERLRPLRIALDVPGTLRELVQRSPRRGAVAEAFEYMGELLALGFSQAKVLEHGATTTRDRALARVLLNAAQRVRRGEALSQSMAATGTARRLARGGEADRQRGTGPDPRPRLRVRAGSTVGRLLRPLLSTISEPGLRSAPFFDN